MIPGRLDEQVSDELLAETRGNPLALLELPRGLSTTQLAGGFGFPAALSLSGRIEESFQRRLEALPDDTQRLLLVAAAEPTGDPDLLWRAGEELEITGAALEPAESAGLIEINNRVRFRHPLVRSAIYRSAAPEQRRRVHRALAEASDVHADPDRRAWHLAEAAASLDEDVAAELERAATRAQARGGLAAAAAFLERASDLTPEPLRRAQRALRAAQTEYEAGALDDAVTLIATAETGTLDDLERARVHLLRAQIAFAARRGSDAPPLLLSAARELDTVDTSLARATYLEAFSAALFAGRLARGGGVVEVAEAVRAARLPPQTPRPPDLLLHGLAVRSTVGYPAGAPILKEALTAFRDNAVLRAEDARWLWFACWVAADLWDDETWDLLSARQLELVRRAGALSAIPFVLTARSAIHVVSGTCTPPRRRLTRSERSVTPLGSPLPRMARYGSPLCGVGTQRSRAVGNRGQRGCRAGEGYALADAELVRAVLYNGLGRYPAAVLVFGPDGERSYDVNTPPRAVAEVIEAAVPCERYDLARRLLTRLADMARASGTDWILGIEARSRALLSEDGSPEDLYREAIERLAHTLLRLELARAHLVYGEWLRRERRRLDAREQLRTAFEMLNAMGIEAFAGRAERELLATGERVRTRNVEVREELTTQEAQVARLARDGLSNAEIGARLFISQHTVAYHLRKVFSKLEITSRNQLDRVLPQNAAVRRTV